MSRRIFKYPLVVTHDTQILYLGSGYKVLSVGVDGAGQLCLWALVEADPNAAMFRHNPAYPLDPEVEIQLRVVGTGWEIQPEGWEFLGTVTIGTYVWHVFQVPA